MGRRSWRLNREAVFEDLGYQPHPGQAEIHRSTALRRIVACGVRWGKTRCAAMEGLLAALEPAQASIGWVVAPTYGLGEKVFREILLLVGQHLSHHLVRIKESEHLILLRNMAGGVSEIRCKTAENPTSLLGEGLDWVVVDEAARLKHSIWQSYLSQRLIDKKGWALLISTPTGKGWFYDLFCKGRREEEPEYASWNSPSWENPYLDPELIEEQRSQVPERVFRQEYGGEFLEGAGAVFRGVRGCAIGAWQDPIPNAGYVAGLDLAKVEDFTVLVIMNSQREVVYVDRFHRLPWDQQIERVVQATAYYNDARTLVDTTGKGEPVFEALERAGCRVVPYTFTAQSKAALINNLSMMIEGQKIVLPRPEIWPEGIDELEAFEYAVTDQGAVRMSAPSGRHDDCVIGLALAAWTIRPNRPMVRVRLLRRLSVREAQWLRRRGKLPPY